MLWSCIQNRWGSLRSYLELLCFELDEVTGWDFRLPPLGKEGVCILFGKKGDQIDGLWHRVVGHHKNRFLFFLSTQLDYIFRFPLKLGVAARLEFQPMECVQPPGLVHENLLHVNLSFSPTWWLNVDVKMALEARHWRWEILCQPGSLC